MSNNIFEIIWMAIALLWMISGIWGCIKEQFESDTTQRYVTIGFICLAISVMYGIKEDVKQAADTIIAPCGSEEVWCRYHVKSKTDE